MVVVAYTQLIQSVIVSVEEKTMEHRKFHLHSGVTTVNRYYVEYFDTMEDEWCYMEYRFYNDASNAFAALSMNLRYTNIKQGNV